MGIYVRELSSEQIKRIEERMRPGAMSESGFLGSSDKLIDVVERDERTLKQLGISPKQIADRLESLIRQARRIIELTSRGKLDIELRERKSKVPRRRAVMMIPEEPGILVEGKFFVSWRSYGGWQDCPFENLQGEPCPVMSYSTTDFKIEDANKRVRLDFPGLAIHLIRDHHFFEGSVKYRVDPAQAVMILELEPGKDHPPRWETEFVWREGSRTSAGLEKLERDNWKGYESFREIVDSPEEIVNLGDQVWLYLRGDMCVCVARSDYCLPQPLTLQGAEWERKEILQGVSGWKRVEHSYVVAQGYERQ